MAWFRVDDQSTFHAKVVRAGNAAYGAWVRLGCHCNAHLTDGFIPDHVARLIASKKELDGMCAAGLAEPADGGYRIHDYLDYQASRAEVIEHRKELSEKRANAGRLGGKASGISRRSKTEAEREPTVKHVGSTTPKQNEAPSHPIPSVSEEPEEEKKQRARAHVEPSRTVAAVQAELEKRGMPMAGGIPALAAEIDRYAAGLGKEAPPLVPEVFAAFDSETSTWQSPKPARPDLVLKHLQNGTLPAIMAGAHTPTKPALRAPGGANKPDTQLRPELIEFQLPVERNEPMTDDVRQGLEDLKRKLGRG